MKYQIKLSATKDYFKVVFENDTVIASKWFKTLDAFKAVGGKTSPDSMGTESWIFPNFVPIRVINEIIDNTYNK